MEHISEMLEEMSDKDTAKRSGKHVKCLRGIRGVPMGEVARIADAAFAEDRPSLPTDESELGALFGAAWEDGLVAIGLLATCCVDRPEDALEIGLDWAERTDDVQTADALGWLVLGPALAMLPQNRTKEVILRLATHHRPAVRRCAVALGMSWTPTVLEGPSAAPLRRKLKQKKIAMSAEADSKRLHGLCLRMVKDQDPSVIKAMRRLVRAWADADPQAVVAWGETMGGGLSKLLRTEVRRAQKRASA